MPVSILPVRADEWPAHPKPVDTSRMERTCRRNGRLRAAREKRSEQEATADALARCREKARIKWKSESDAHQVEIGRQIERQLIEAAEREARWRARNQPR